MPKPPSRTIYRQIGSYYDQLWPGAPTSWRQARRRILSGVLPTMQAVCELGCGTGNSALDFARRGLRVFAVDLSPAMLRMTRQKAQAAGLSIRIRCADMRTFRLPEPVDLVHSEWGAVNHIPRKKDLAKVARAVHRALRPGGYFLFDVNHLPVFERLWSQTQARETKDLFIVQQGGLDRVRDKGWLDMTWFVAGPAGRWKRQSQRIEEVYWSPAEIRQVLHRAGFPEVRAFDFTVLVSDFRVPRSYRGFKTLFLARKSRH